MSSEVKGATQAMAIAQNAARAAGLYFIYIYNAKKEDNFWIISMACLPGDYIVKIDASTGEVVELSLIKTK